MAPPPKKIVAPSSSAVSNYVESLQKSFGSKEIVHLLTQDASSEVEVIPTGIPALDVALGCGGIPRGRVIEIYGPESSGKTTLALQIAGQAQKDGQIVHFIDAEHALDVVYAQKLGVDLGQFPISQPNNGEEALDVAEHAVNNGVGLVIIDSVAALVPKSEIEGDMGDPQMGLQARLMSQAMRKITAAAFQNKCTVIFINQLRMKIGVMFGNPETTTGGNALKFYASVRIDIRKTGMVSGKGADSDPIGQKSRIKIVKNKCAPPFRECEIDLLFGQGFDNLGSLLDTAIEKEVIKKNGAWFSYKEEKWQGREEMREALEARPETLKEIAEAL